MISKITSVLNQFPTCTLRRLLYTYSITKSSGNGDFLHAKRSVQVCARCFQKLSYTNARVPGYGTRRFVNTSPPRTRPQTDHKSVVMYITAVGIAMVGGAYAGVPLYRMFCAATGLGGNTSLAHDTSGKIESLEKVDDRVITVRFNADVASSMQWNFRPQQTEIKVAPGETALAFYTARNPTDKPIVGISSYSVIPYDAGQYFNKIQCFCFEEQILNPNEEVDMPVFFYIDPEYATDPRLEDKDEITLSYTFFEAKEGMSLPLPGFAQKAH